jgi:phosphoribosylaminoimidazolecarboxamide formyltransferase/IMP cyclohydrolase
MAARRALISVYDKSGLEGLVEALGELGFEIVSSGGTAKRVRELGYKQLTEVSDYTGFPESPGGLLKTLHPRVHGGLLLSRGVPEHRAYMDRHGIQSFDLVVVNLYPFEATVAKGADLKTAAENIDIGGPTMIRSAAKAALLYGRVAVVTDTSQYPEIIRALRGHGGELPKKLVRSLAEKAFRRTSEYDSAIAEYLEADEK